MTQPLSQVRPVPGVPESSRACHRFDPYWDGMWVGGSSASWVSAIDARSQQRAGLARIPAEWSMSPGEAWEVLTGEKLRKVILSMLGAACSWRTLTAQQMAAITGYPALASTSHLTRAAFAASLLDIGVLHSAMATRPAAAGAISLRPTRSRVLAREFLPTLTYPEQISVSGGKAVGAGSQYDRHNILTTELGLRVAEMCDVGAVLGESLSSVDHLVGTGLGRASLKTNTRTADATFIRGDGLRIAVEVSPSAAPGLRKKVHRWCQVLMENSPATSGLVVLFVTAPPPDRALGRGVASSIRKAVGEVVREYPGPEGHRPADRIFLAEWADWFPATGEVDESFLSLTAERADYVPGKAWSPVELLNPFDLTFQPEHPEAMTAVLAGAAALGQSPTWLRADPVQLWPVALQRLGLAAPVLPPRKQRTSPGPGRFPARRGALNAPVGPPGGLLPGPHVARPRTVPPAARPPADTPEPRQGTRQVTQPDPAPAPVARPWSRSSSSAPATPRPALDLPAQW